MAYYVKWQLPLENVRRSTPCHIYPFGKHAYLYSAPSETSIIANQPWSELLEEHPRSEAKYPERRSYATDTPKEVREAQRMQ